MDTQNRIRLENDLDFSELPPEQQLQIIFESEWKPDPERAGIEGGFVFIAGALMVIVMIVGFVMLVF